MFISFAKSRTAVRVPVSCQVRFDLNSVHVIMEPFWFKKTHTQTKTKNGARARSTRGKMRINYVLMPRRCLLLWHLFAGILLLPFWFGFGGNFFAERSFLIAFFFVVEQILETPKQTRCSKKCTNTKKAPIIQTRMCHHKKGSE